MSLLTVKDLTIDVGEPGTAPIVNNVNFNLAENEALGIVGESGSGKTQLVLSLLRLVPAHFQVGGEVSYQGQDLLQLEPAQLNPIRANEIAVVFQDAMSALNPYLKISTQLTEALVRYKQLTYAQALQRAIEMLERVHISNAAQRIHDYPYQFSGGMRQRIMIAMALLREPKILIADEPTTALDVTVQAELLALIKQLRADFNLSLIFITHDMSIVAGQCDRVLVMYAGRVVEQAKIRALFSAPKHPYTQGLIETARSQSGLVQHLAGIPGQFHHTDRERAGCVFSPRCTQRLAHCEQEVPLLLGTPEQQQACHLYAK